MARLMFDALLNMAMEEGRLLDECMTVAAYICRHRHGLPPEREAWFERSWRQRGGKDWYDRFQSVRT